MASFFLQSVYRSVVASELLPVVHQEKINRKIPVLLKSRKETTTNVDCVQATNHGPSSSDATNLDITYPETTGHT